MSRLAWLLAALLLAPSIASSQTSAPRKRVLILHDHTPNAPGVVAFLNELRALVEAEAPNLIEFYDELLDFDRFPGSEERLDELRRYIDDKYRGVRPDVILTQGSFAVPFAVEQMRTVFPGVPVVFGLTFEPGVDFARLPAHVTGVRQQLPYAATYSMARALQPNAERVVLIGGVSARDSVLLATAARELTPLLAGMELVLWQDWSYESLLRDLRTLPPRTITILSSLRRDRNGQQLITGDLIASVASVASAPAYGVASNWIGDGIVGGALMDVGVGAATGKLLLDVLSRAPGEPLPPPQLADLSPTVDWRQLERWGLSEEQLPAGTEVLFRTPTIWERFRVLILAVALLTVAQSTLITLMVLERRRRLRAQRVAEESRDQLAHLARVTTVGEMTAAISHELRQPLAAMRAHAEAGQLLLERSPPDVSEVREVLRDIVGENVRAAEVMDHIRTLLRKGQAETAAVDLNDVCRRATDLLKQDAARRGVQLRVTLQPDLPRVVGDGVQLQQVILNLAINAMDAAQASPRGQEVVVGTSAESGGVELFVRDTGPGLQPEAQVRIFEPFFSTKTHGLGMGLAIVRSIVERHHGRVRVDNDPGGGAVFRVRLPIGEP
jgi:signal transduction histidine kinase